MENLLEVKFAALLHDIGKPSCWAYERSWGHHIEDTRKIVAEVLGEEMALTAMRHHSGLSYDPSYHPKSDVEKIVAVSDNIASGADRPKEEEARSMGPHPRPPIRMSHVLSDGTKHTYSKEAKDLAFFTESFKNQFKGREATAETYLEIFNFLKNSIILEVPADTRPPHNDVSLWDHLKLTAAIAGCLASDGYRGENLERYRLTLISGDADRVSDYVNQSSRFPDLRAGSARVSRATEYAAELISKMQGPESVIFSGGGSFLVLCPPESAQKIVETARNGFEEATGEEITATVSRVDCNGKDLQQRSGDIWKRALSAMHLAKASREAKALSPVNEGIRLCDICKVREGTHEDREKILPIDASPRYEALCVRCWNRRLWGRSLERPVELDQIKDARGYVSVIKADGDNIGEVLSGKTIQEKFKKVATPSRLSTISRLIDKECGVELRRLVESHGGECVFAGGDDILAVVKGEKGLTLARELASAFETAMEHAATMSAGVAIFDYKLPLYAGLEAATELLSASKKSIDKGSVSFAIMGGTGTTKAELGKRRAYKWTELDGLLRLVESFRREALPSSKLRSIAWMARREGREEAQTLVKYHLGRQEIPWTDGTRLVESLNSELFGDAYSIYITFRTPDVSG